jgi:hypothetical protein
MELIEVGLNKGRTSDARRKIWDRIKLWPRRLIRHDTTILPFQVAGEHVLSMISYLSQWVTSPNNGQEVAACLERFDLDVPREEPVHKLRKPAYTRIGH